MQSAKLGNFTIYYDNSEEYHRIKREVWGSDSYYIELESETPTIVDAGAHIGVSTLYFKRLYPEAKIIAVEPLPENLALLKKNIYENQLEGVEVVEKALSASGGRKAYYLDNSSDRWYSTASLHEGAWTGDQDSRVTTVESVKLSEILQQYKPDLIKLDIEGAEDEVVWEARDSLGSCPNYLIEFHPVEGKGMERIVKILEDRGYEVSVTSGGKTVLWEKARGLSIIEARK